MKKTIYFILVLFCVFIITGCNSMDLKIKEEPNKFEQLSNYLISNGWEKIQDSEYDYSLTDSYVLDENEKPINVDIYYLNIKKMSIQRIRRITKLGVSTTNYSLKSNISTGTVAMLNEKDEWEQSFEFTYNFNSGSLTSDENSPISLCTDLAVELKEKLEKIIYDADLNLEEFK